MKRTVIRRVKLGLAAAGLCIAFLAASSAWPRSQTRPAAAATSRPEADTRVKADKLKQAGLAEALAGKFADGLLRLRQARKLAPDDEGISAAIKLLAGHLRRVHRANDERAAEYEAAVQRVRRGMLAQAHLPKLVKAKIDQKLRKAIREDLITAYNGCGTSDALDGASPQEVAELKKESLAALARSVPELAKAAKLLKSDKKEYAETFRGLIKTAETRLAAYERAWKSIRTDDAKALRAAAEELKVLEEDVGEALGDLDAMVSPKPWRIALSQARLAKQLAFDKEKVVGEDWYRAVVADAEARGGKAVEGAEWQEALSAYAELKDLNPDTDLYRSRLKTVQRHVRVLRLYGEEPSGASPNEEPAWKTMVANVDAEMVKAAIGQLDQYYVTAVDYRKITRGALRGVKVLTETPQAANSFAALADENKRKRFLDAIANQLEGIEKKDRVDGLDLQLVLNGVLRASEQSVEIPTEVLAMEFADGFLDELDKFSAMIWPNDVTDFQKQTMGHFHGVGIQISKELGQPLKVVTPLLDTPAFRAGIKPGDLIVAVNGQETEDEPLEKLIKRIMGPKGTKVVLRIKRAGRPKPFDAPIIRDQIHIRTVKGWQRYPEGERRGQWDHVMDPEEKIGYIRITQFTDQTPRNVAEILRQLAKMQLQSVVLDMRFNPGGLLQAAGDVANEFLSAGRIVSTRGRQTRPSEIFASTKGSYLRGDIVLLVNQYSASAAEIVSGALKDWDRGLVVGQRTYGKGSVQNVIRIRGRRALLKLTTAYYYLPKRKLIHRQNGAKEWGVDPDVEVFITPKQMRRWLGIRQKTDLLQDVRAGQLQGELAEQYDADVQLSTAVMLLKLLRLQEAKPAA